MSAGQARDRIAARSNISAMARRQKNERRTQSNPRLVLLAPPPSAILSSLSTVPSNQPTPTDQPNNNGENRKRE